MPQVALRVVAEVVGQPGFAPCAIVAHGPVSSEQVYLGHHEDQHQQGVVVWAPPKPAQITHCVSAGACTAEAHLEHSSGMAGVAKGLLLREDPCGEGGGMASTLFQLSEILSTVGWVVVQEGGWAAGAEEGNRVWSYGSRCWQQPGLFHLGKGAGGTNCLQPEPSGLQALGEQGQRAQLEAAWAWACPAQFTMAPMHDQPMI